MTGSPIAAHAWRIGISQRELAAAPGREGSDALDAGYVPWLLRLVPNALALPLPNFEDPAQALRHAAVLGINALLLSGGGDLGAQPRREAQERALLAEARSARWPVLGICRGMQLLQQISGGELVKLPGHVGTPHPLRLSEASDAADRAELETTRVNSWHRFGIMRAAADWQVLAQADDGSIEAMRHRALPWLGLMWHPERASGGAACCLPWLRALFTPSPCNE